MTLILVIYCENAFSFLNFVTSSNGTSSWFYEFQKSIDVWHEWILLLKRVRVCVFSILSKAMSKWWRQFELYGGHICRRIHGKPVNQNSVIYCDDLDLVFFTATHWYICLLIDITWFQANLSINSFDQNKWKTIPSFRKHEKKLFWRNTVSQRKHCF